MRTNFISLIVLFLLERFLHVSSSHGDRSMIYQRCLKKCVQDNCTDVSGSTFKKNAVNQQEFWCVVLRWSCGEECYYQCMWHTVGTFVKAGEGVPKFHGKWPFHRFMGMQEPASVFASVLNFAANFHMYKKLCREFPMSMALRKPLILFYKAYAMVCMNAWVWSTIFHMRDTPFTEFMDYACALSMVMGLFVASIVRVCYKRTKLLICLLLIPLFYFVTHVRYLYTGAINYDYNMKLNIFFGGNYGTVCISGHAQCIRFYNKLPQEAVELWIGGAGALIWVVVSCMQLRSGSLHAWRMCAFTALSGAALSLELLDGAPRGGWDAHALWHLATSPLPLLFYQYVIDDLRYLQSKEQQKYLFKLT